MIAVHAFKDREDQGWLKGILNEGVFLPGERGAVDYVSQFVDALIDLDSQDLMRDIEHPGIFSHKQAGLQNLGLIHNVTQNAFNMFYFRARLKPEAFLVEEKFGKYFGYLATCEGKFCI